MCEWVCTCCAEGVNLPLIHWCTYLGWVVLGSTVRRWKEGLVMSRRKSFPSHFRHTNTLSPLNPNFHTFSVPGQSCMSKHKCQNRLPLSWLGYLKVCLEQVAVQRIHSMGAGVLMCSIAASCFFFLPACVLLSSIISPSRTVNASDGLLCTLCSLLCVWIFFFFVSFIQNNTNPIKCRLTWLINGFNCHWI